ncbi:MAG: efflux RND transporter permease subunit [Sandaracinus sp.]|nr:efflux RND transporter permease subunit [Sandaracinus sp.]MCB9630766.1 efflux RND transporter permease subunit [Sandaracinus sp.]
MIEWLVRRNVFVYVLAFFVTVFGTATYFSLPREASPDVQIPLIVVTTPYVGVSPEDVESLVTVPLENELSGVKDLKKMTSTSYEGASVVFLEFEPEVVIQDALQRVRDRVNRARPKLPDDIEETEITEINFSDFPILLVTLGGDLDELELKRLGENLEDELRRIPGVLDAVLSGGREREIQVQVDPNRLAHYGLSLNDVLGAIADENVNVPGGDVRTGDGNVLLRVPGEIEDPHELEAIAIKRVGDRPVFVRDVATVVDGFAPRDTYARMNGQSAVSIAVSKRSGANIVQVVDAVKAVVAEHAERWPAGVEHRFLGDQSKIVHDMVGELENGIITGLILVVGVLLFFMGVRNSFFVALAIPLSMLLAFIVVALFDMTLNMIVLFSLIMALGMLVDNAIVLVENIYRHVEEGKSLRDASIEGTKEVAEAVTASTATTVAAFLPLVFWTGVMGQFMGYLPKTIIIVLLASLVIAILTLPVFTAAMMRKSKKTREISVDGSDLNFVMRGYKAVLEWSIRRRYIALGLGLGAFVGTFMAYGALNHGTEFFPETEPNRAFVSIRAPLGTDLETTDRIVRQVEAALAAQENVDVFVAEVGISGGQDPVQGSQLSPHNARITVDFLPDANTARPGERVRVESTSGTIDRLRDLVAEIPGAEVRIEKENMGPPVGKPIDVRVSGDDYHRLGQLAARVRREIAERIEGATDLSDDYRVGRPEMRLRIDRGAAKRVGASTQAIAGAVRTAVNGTVASTLRDGDEEHDIVVQLAPQFRDDLQSVLGLRIDGREDTSPDTFPVPLATVARFELAGGSGAITHLDQDLIVSVTGDVSEGFNANAVQAEVLRYIDEAEMPEGYHLSLGGSNDEQVQTAEFMGRALLIGLALILLVLIYQFNGLSSPLIVMMSVLLSLIGVLWGLILTGTPFGIMMTGLGVISLAGVVVNNAIVLLDYVEQLRQRGMGVVEALVQSGLTRFRPVILTALTTVLGLVPMAVGVSLDFREFPPKIIVGSQSAMWWGPMAVAIIFGLVVATVLTLVMVPTLYSIFDDLKRLPSRVRARLRGEPRAAAGEAESAAE